MAKSKIIKDLANGNVDTITALKRAKVLLSELNNDKITNWINHELIGYPADAPLPDYRISKGNLVGSYFKGSMASHMTWTNVSIPLGKMPKELQDALLSVQFREGIEALRKLATSESIETGHLGKMISADLFSNIALYNQDPYMNITSAMVIVSPHTLNNIFSVVENRLLDMLLLLEKEFGTLDDLDIDISVKTTEELQNITQNIIYLIYNDNSVSIGDGNKIQDSSVASLIEKK